MYILFPYWSGKTPRGIVDPFFHQVEVWNFTRFCWVRKPNPRQAEPWEHPAIDSYMGSSEGNGLLATVNKQKKNSMEKLLSVNELQHKSHIFWFFLFFFNGFGMFFFQKSL